MSKSKKNQEFFHTKIKNFKYIQYTVIALNLALKHTS